MNACSDACILDEAVNVKAPPSNMSNCLLQEGGCSTPRVASVSVQLEQDSNKSEQLERAPRCNVRTCRQSRKGKARVTAPALLVQNLLETL